MCLLANYAGGCLKTSEEFIEFAKLGCYVEFDFFGSESSYYQYTMEIDFFSDAQRMDFFKDLVDEGYEDQLVMAHDIHKKIQLVSENVLLGVTNWFPS